MIYMMIGIYFAHLPRWKQITGSGRRGSGLVGAWWQWSPVKLRLRERLRRWRRWQGVLLLAVAWREKLRCDGEGAMATQFAGLARIRGLLFIAGKGVEACDARIQACSISKVWFDLVSVRIQFGKTFSWEELGLGHGSNPTGSAYPMLTSLARLRPNP
jgi:hypothetical protein